MGSPKAIAEASREPPKMVTEIDIETMMKRDIQFLAKVEKIVPKLQCSFPIREQ